MKPRAGGTKQKLWGQVFPQIIDVVISNALFSSTGGVGSVGGLCREMHLRCFSSKRAFYFAFI